MKLYGYWRSSASWRVRIGLALKGIDYEYVAVNLVADGGAQRGDAYRALNPMMQVPTLVWSHDGEARVLSQSLPILEWLDETHPSPPLLPADPFLRARARSLAEIVNAGMQPMQNLEAQRFIRDELKGDAAAFTRHFLIRGTRALEAAAAQTAGDFLVGDAPTLADVCLVPQLFGCRRFGVDLDDFPTLLRVEARCAAMAAFQAAHPDAQPDAVKG
ncbi:MAG: maleylacetoacetate isomerase [Polyangiales bacterium]